MKSNFKHQVSKIIPAIRFGESVNWVAFRKDVSLLSAFQSSARYNFESFKLLDIVKNWTARSPSPTAYLAGLES